MHLHIQQRDREGITLLDMKGRLVAGDEAGAFRDLIDGLAKGGPAKIILNMREVDFIDSLGLGTMVMCYSRLKKTGGVAKLSLLNRRNLELLLLTKIDTIFEVFDDETEAVNSFFPDRAIRRFDILDFVQQMERE
ncbi:MAG TPA: STAS domain-containing protein [Bryobacteraceae bacterium]|jgi:anti-sigma B factor antagonist